MVGIFGVPIERIGKFAPFNGESEDIRAIGSHLRVQLKAIGDGCVGRDHGVAGRDLPLRCSQRDSAVLLGNFFHWTVGKETNAAALANGRKSGEIFKGVEFCLAWISKDMPVLAAFERHADQPMNGSADLAHRFELLIEYIGRHAVTLKKIAVSTEEVAGNILAGLDVLDPVDGGSLTFVEQLGGIGAAQLLEFAHQIIAKRRKMRRRARRHTACDAFAINDDD